MSLGIVETRKHYESMMYKEALRTGFFEFQVASFVRYRSFEINDSSGDLFCATGLSRQVPGTFDGRIEQVFDYEIYRDSDPAPDADLPAYLRARVAAVGKGTADSSSFCLIY